MIKRQIRDYLEDILDAINAIEQFTIGIDYESFVQNLEKVFAVSVILWRDQGDQRSRCRHGFQFNLTFPLNLPHETKTG